MNTTEQKIYKIRDTKTGLFSTGGMRPRWTNVGKSWTRLGYVHSHITQLMSNYTPADVYKDAEVVEAVITHTLTTIEPAKDWLNKAYAERIDHLEAYASKSSYDYSGTINTLKARRDTLNAK